MTLPAFAAPSDVYARLPGGEELGDERTQAALDDVSALIRAEADGKTWVTNDALDSDLPDVLKAITCKAAIRALTNPAGVTQETTGPFSTTHGEAYLTSAEKRIIHGLTGVRAGLWVQPTSRGDQLETGPMQDQRSDQTDPIESFASAQANLARPRYR